MAEHGLVVEGVWKRFHKGEVHDSLRDLIPAVARRLLGRGPRRDQLEQGDFWALRDISFEVKPGEALGIIGPNGAGKSTMLKILNRILRPNRGSVAVRGRVGALIEIAAGFHGDLTGRENVFLQGAIMGMKRAHIESKFDEIVAFSGIEDFIDTPVKRYSTGMNARLGFSIATSLDQDVLLIDEVLSVGDWAFQKKSSDRMTELVKGGAAVVFVSHNLRAISSICDKALLLDHGRNVLYGDADEVVSEHLSGQTDFTKLSEGAHVEIEAVRILGSKGETTSMVSGERATVEIDIVALRKCKNIAVGISLQQDNGWDVFNTSSIRLGERGLCLEKGARCICAFDFTMHLAAGTFLLEVGLREYNPPITHHVVFPAGRIHIHNHIDVRGVVNLEPRVRMMHEPA